MGTCFKSEKYRARLVSVYESHDISNWFEKMIFTNLAKYAKA